jgi:PadR family transcriptional regulator PadR
MLAEWKRGMLTFWALALVAQRPWYGLEISKHIERSTQGELRLGVSTIYPLLRRLQARGLVSGRRERTTAGPPRAYYSATAAGRQVLARYVRSVLSPDSPVNRALSEVLRDLMPLLGSVR